MTLTVMISFSATIVRCEMGWNGAQDYVRLTNCVECDTQARLTDSLCHGCRVSMGYENEEE